MFLEMAKATRRPRPAPPPGQGRRHAVGQHHRRRPQRQRRLRRPLGGPERVQRDGPAVHDARSARCCTSSPGCPASTAPGPAPSCAWGTDPDASRPGHLRARATCPSSSRRNWVMNANDSYWTPNTTDPARGLRADHRLRGVRADHAHAGWSRSTSSTGWPATAAPARRARAACARHEHENRVRAAEVMRAGGDLDDAVRRDRRDRGLRRAGRLGRALVHADVGRAPTSSRSSSSGRRRTSLWEVPFDAADPFNTPRDLAETNADVQAAMKADAIAHLRDAGRADGRDAGARSRSPATAAPRRSRSAAAWATRPATPTRCRRTRRCRTRTASSRSPTAPRTSRRSRSWTRARSRPGRS